MAGTEIKNAIDNVADAVGKSDSQGTLGIKGMVLNNLGNVGAMVIIAGAFLYLGQDMVKQGKEDRVMFREEIKAQRASQEVRWEKTDIAHGKAMEKMGSTIERAVTSMETAVTELKTATNRIGRPPD